MARPARASLVIALVVMAPTIMSLGCARTGTTKSGFLSDYHRLETITSNERRFADADGLASVKAIQLEAPRAILEDSKEGKLLSEARVAELVAHIQFAVEREMAGSYPLVDAPGPGVARLRVAVTDVKKPAVLLNLHPASKLTGAGVGSATIESELISTQTGKQLEAVVEAHRGDQFEFDTFSEIEDAMDAIDTWARNLRKRLDAARGIMPQAEQRPTS